MVEVLTVLGVGAALLETVLSVPLQRVDVGAETLSIALLAGRVRADGLVDTRGSASRHEVLDLSGADCRDGRKGGKHVSAKRSHGD